MNLTVILKNEVLSKQRLCFEIMSLMFSVYSIKDNVKSTCMNKNLAYDLFVSLVLMYR